MCANPGIAIFPASAQETSQARPGLVERAEVCLASPSTHPKVPRDEMHSVLLCRLSNKDNKKKNLSAQHGPLVAGSQRMTPHALFVADVVSN